MATATTARQIVCNNRADWLAARRSIIGASDSAAIFGEGYANQSPMTVYASKASPLADDDDFESEDDDGADHLRIGQLLEPSLRAILAWKTGLTVEPPREFTIDVHPEIEWLGASLDSTIIDPEWGRVPAELKNVSGFLSKDWGDEQEAPLKFLVQLQHQLAVTGAPGGYLCGLIAGSKPVVRRVPRNQGFIEVMIGKLAEFWECIQSRKLPPVTGTEATRKALSMLWPQDNGESVMLPQAADEWHEGLEKAKADAKDAEQREKYFGNLIRASIGEAAYGITPGGQKYSWKTQVAHHKAKPAHEKVSRVLRLCK